MVHRVKAISQVEDVKKLVASRYNVRSYDAAGNLLLYNSFTGKFRKVQAEIKEQAIDLLESRVSEADVTCLQEALFREGFLVTEDTNEFMRASLQQKQHQYENRILQLILMPNENCNFRCVYCYESFAKNKMDEQTQRGVVEYVRKEIHKYDLLHISWFGGEPLTALDIVESLSKQLLAICKEQGKRYFSNMTTNGYLLTPDVFDKLYRLRVSSYQITFDGTKETHDQHRVLADGRGSFDVIFNNLKRIKEMPHAQFLITLRSNVDQENQYQMHEYMDLVQETFGGDKRFSNHFVPVQKMGGEQDANIHLCDNKDIIPLMEEGIDKGLNFAHPLHMFQPNRSICYAAKPSSFVIGSDGMVYKCTVAFDDERNHVGQLYEDGQMEIYFDRFALWVANGAAEDTRCQKCHFRPACQGEACPLEKIESGRTPCPPVKKNMKAYLRLIDKQGDVPLLI